MNTPRKKLLIFHPALAPYRLDFFNAMADNYDCLVVFLLRNLRSQSFDQQLLLSNARFKYKYLDKRIIIKRRIVNLGYIREIRDFNPDIIVGMEYGLPLLVPYFHKKLSSKSYSLYTICDDSIDIANNCKGIRRILRDYLVPRINNLITISEDVAQWYSNRFQKEAEPIVFPIIREDAKYRAELKESIPISNENIERFKLAGSKIFLYVGRFAAVKNLSYLLSVFNEYAKGRNVKLLLVGAGDESDNLQDQRSSLSEKEKIIFIDRCEGANLIAWYNVAQTFILPSTYEPFGAVVGEALAAGCYCLCSEYAGASVLVSESNGHIFNPDTYNDLMGKLLMIDKKMNACSTIETIKKSCIKASFKDYVDLLLTKLV